MVYVVFELLEHIWYMCMYNIIISRTYMYMAHVHVIRTYMVLYINIHFGISTIGVVSIGTVLISNGSSLGALQ